MPSGLSNEPSALFDSCTKNNHFLLGKMLDVRGRVTLILFFPLTAGICERFARGGRTLCEAPGV